MKLVELPRLEYVNPFYRRRRKKKKKSSSRRKIKLRKPKVLKVVKRQSGERKSLRLDRLRKALPPGKRRSKSGKIYYEYRRNRSDLRKGI
jgi:hypothetical protein